MKTILVVEDDHWFAELYRDQLSRFFTVCLAGSAQQAMDALDETPPAAIVLDLMLPEVNGVAFLQELRSHTDVMQLPVVVCSSAALGEAEKQALRQFGVAAIFDKAALSMKDVVHTLRELTKEQGDEPKH